MAGAGPFLEGLRAALLPNWVTGHTYNVPGLSQWRSLDPQSVPCFDMGNVQEVTRQPVVHTHRWAGYYP